MIIFSVPKPFTGEFEIIQNNAIRSWLCIKPKPRIILLGNEKGIKEVSTRYGVEYVQTIKMNKEGTPLLDSIFQVISSYKSDSIKLFINSDIILHSFPMAEIQKIILTMKECLIVGRRYEKRIVNAVDVAQVSKSSLIKGLPYKSNSWIDYFLFTDNVFRKVPPFALGRTFWDKWLVGSTLRNKIAVIDATSDICAIHQSHTYSFHKKKNRHIIWAGQEALNNLRLAGGWGALGTIGNATHALVHGNVKNVFKIMIPIDWVLDMFPGLWPFFLQIRLLREVIVNRE